MQASVGIGTLQDMSQSAVACTPTSATTPAPTDLAYELVYDGGECFSSDKRLSAGDDSLAECAAACASDSDGCAYFIFRPTGNTQCYAEYPSNPTADNNYCGEGFDSDSYDFYRLLPDSPTPSALEDDAVTTTADPTEEAP